MKKMKKWALSIIASCAILSLSVQPLVYADWNNMAYEEKTGEYIAKGVKYENIKRLTDQGWVNVNVLRMDLNEKYNKLDVLTHQDGLSNKARLSELVAQNPNVVGAINGDFFNMHLSETLGPIVKSGELITSPFYLPQNMATFNITNDNNPFISHWTTPELRVTNKTRPAELKFVAINKNSQNNDTAILFNNKWGHATPVITKKITNIVEMSVQNNHIVEIATHGKGCAIPKDGYVIWATGSFASHIMQYFAVGDAVDLTIASTPDFNTLSTSFGGGGIIVKDGIPQTTFNHEIKGIHPRTAVGINKEKTELILVTIDGRTSSFVGVSQRELGQIMASLGAHEAINLDGGGSTEMIVRPQGEENKKIINNLSDGSERRLMEGIGIVNTAPKSENIGSIKIQSIDSNVFLGTSRFFTIKGYDENFHPANVNLDEVQWSISGVEGTFEGNKFIPTTTGEGIITAEYKGVTTTFPIHVLDHPVALKVSPNKITTDSQKQIQVYAVNEDGYKAIIHPIDLKIEIPEGIGNIDQDGVFHSSGNNSGIIKITFKDQTSYIPVGVGYNEKIVDEFETVNARFLSYPEVVTGKVELSNNHKFGNHSVKLSYDFTGTDATRAAYMVFDPSKTTFYQKPAKFGMWVYGNEGGSHSLKMKLVDTSGNIYALDAGTKINWEGWQYVEAFVPQEIQTPFHLERIYVVETDPALQDTGSIYIDNLTAYYPAEISEQPENSSNIKDNRQVHEELKNENSFTFFANGAIANLHPLDINQIAKVANNTHFNLFTGNVDPMLTNQLKNSFVIANGGYSATNYKNSLFIKLNNANGSLRKIDFNQLSWFINTLNNTNASSIFISMPNQLKFSDPLEEKLFMDTLKKIKKEKQVDLWVLTSGKDLKVTPQEGIRYVTLPANSFNYIKFTVNDKATYEILPVYQ